MKNKSAFTMIELVFVIVVLGILASLAMGRMDRDLKQEAAETILSHIRLTQQLALRDNKHLPDGTANRDKWQRAYWRIDFNCDSSCRYLVGSDMNLDGTVEIKESAIDPTDGKYIFNDDSGDSNNSNKVLLEKKFGINSINSSCSSKSISFDYLGRVYLDVNASSNTFLEYMKDDCNLTFSLETDSDFNITIKAETGHAFIVGQENS